jgi:cytochrome c-type biogenesis protein CcmH
MRAKPIRRGRFFTAQKIWLVAVLALALALSVTMVAVAQDSTPRPITDDQVNAVARGLYCPVCENIPLDVCPTQACAQWRELIRVKLAQGWTDTQIKQYFVDQYGDRVLATPPARGLNWLVYIIPPVAILAGVYILYRAFQAWKKPELTTPAATSAQGEPTTIDNQYIVRIEEELKKR